MLDKSQLEKLEKVSPTYLSNSAIKKLFAHIKALQVEVDRRGNLMLETQWQTENGYDFCIYCDHLRPGHEFDCDIRDVKLAPPDR